MSYRLHKAVALLLTLLSVAWAATPGVGHAQQQPTPTPALLLAPLLTTTPVATTLPAPMTGPAQQAGDPNFYSLADITDGEIVLRGPFDSTELSFALPNTWKVDPKAALQLNMGVFVSGQGSLSTAGFGGLLIVRLNDQQISTIDIDQVGDRTVTIPLPADLLGIQPDGRETIAFELDMGVSCDLAQQTNIVLRSTSGLSLPHTIVQLPTSLDQLPRPIFQRALEPDSALLVMPDSPKAEELQAALTVAAAFGRITGGRLLLGFVTEKMLTPQQRAENHLVFVGGLGAFPALQGAQLPAALGGPKITTDGIGDDDGVLQMVVSPWNPARALLSVSGNSPAGVVKAAQAVSNNLIRSYVQPNLAVVTRVEPTIKAASLTVDRSMADLGYGQRTITDRSSTTLEYRFEIPPGQVAGAESYLRLAFAHSAQIDPQRSGATIRLNDQPIGSVPLTDASTRLTSAQYPLPASLLRSGTNYLQIATDLTRYTGCADQSSTDIWFTVGSDSMLHLPLQEGGASVAPPFSLASFPGAYTANRDLADTLFVLSPDDPSGWTSAAQIAYEIGRRSSGPLVAPGAIYVEGLSEILRAERHLIIVGRASRLPIIGELNDVLPAPFNDAGDYATERGIQFQYRIPPGASIGYLEAIPSPWNAQYGVLTVLGSDDAGVRSAAAALVDSANRGRLNTGLMVVNGTQLIGGIVPTAGPAVTMLIPPISETAQVAGQPGWVVPAIIGAAVALVLVVIVALVGALRRRPRRLATMK